MNRSLAALNFKIPETQIALLWRSILHSSPPEAGTDLDDRQLRFAVLAELVHGLRLEPTGRSLILGSLVEHLDPLPSQLMLQIVDRRCFTVVVNQEPGPYIDLGTGATVVLTEEAEESLGLNLLKRFRSRLQS
jgi:hypothetical protein